MSGLPASSTRYGIRWPEPDGATLHINLLTHIIERQGPPARTRRVVTCFTTKQRGPETGLIADRDEVDRIEVYVSRSGQIRVFAKGKLGEAEMTPGEWKR